MSVFRARHIMQLRGLLRHAQQLSKQDTCSSRGRMNALSMQRSQGHRDLRVHRQSDRAWKPPPASNQHLMDAPFRAEHGSANMGGHAFGRVKSGPRNGAKTSTTEQVSATGSGNPIGGGMFLSYHDLELALERRGLNAVRFLLSVAGALTVGIGLMWPRIKRWGAAEGAEVAAASLQQEELKVNAAALVNALLTDPKTGEQVEILMKKTLLNLLEDEETKEKATKWTAEIFSDAMMWPAVLAKGSEYVESVLKDEKSIDHAYDYFAEAAQRTVKDERVLDAASQALWASVRGIFGRRREASAVVKHDATTVAAQTAASSAEK